MYTHTEIPLSFRLSTDPWGGQKYRNNFDMRLQNFLLRPLLDYVYKELDRIQAIKVRKTTLSLVNIYSAFTQTSVGKVEFLTNTQIQRGPLTLTFALRNREFAGFPQHVIWNTGHSCTWGPTLQYSLDFVTISVPISVCVATRIPSVMLPVLKRLYAILGAVTKSYALNRLELSSYPVESLYSKLYYKTIPKTLFYNNLNDLQYCMEVWEHSPNLLTPVISEKFIDYYVRYLTKHHRKFKDKYVDEVYIRIEDEVKSYVLKSMQGTPVIESISSKVPSDNVNVSQLVKQICSGEV